MMISKQKSAVILSRKRRVRRKIAEKNAPPQEGMFQKRASSALTGLKKVFAVLMGLQDALVTLIGLKKVLFPLFIGLGSMVAISTMPTRPLHEIFPQADAGQQFSWAHPDNSVKAEFTSECAQAGLSDLLGLFGTSVGLRLNYGLPGMESGGWGVHWNNSPTKHFDAAKFNSLIFWVRGISGSELFQIGLKDTNLREAKVESKDWITANALKEGVKVAIPLAEFKDLNKASLNNVTFSFNRLHGSGSVCIDDIALVE